MNDTPGPVRAVLEADMDIELFQRALGEEPSVAEPVTGGPFLRDVLPMQGDKADPGCGVEPDTAIRLRSVPNIMLRQAYCLVVAPRIGKRFPDLFPGGLEPADELS